MITYYVSADAVALGLTENEKNTAKKLVNQCLRDHGMTPWESMESEIFLTAGESLLIARPKAPKTKRIEVYSPRLYRRRA